MAVFIEALFLIWLGLLVWASVKFVRSIQALRTPKPVARYSTRPARVPRPLPVRAPAAHMIRTHAVPAAHIHRTNRTS